MLHMRSRNSSNNCKMYTQKEKIICKLTISYDIVSVLVNATVLVSAALVHVVAMYCQ